MYNKQFSNTLKEIMGSDSLGQAAMKTGHALYSYKKPQPVTHTYSVDKIYYEEEWLCDLFAYDLLCPLTVLEKYVNELKHSSSNNRFWALCNIFDVPKNVITVQLNRLEI